MKYSDFESGQIYGDYVILGFSLDKLKQSLLGHFNLRTSDFRLLFGYWYFKDNQYLNDFLDRCLMGILKVVLVKKDLSDNTIYELDRGKPDEFVVVQKDTFKSEPFNSNLLGEKEKRELSTYLLKYNLIHTNNKCYTKEQIFYEVIQYVLSKEFETLSIKWYNGIYNYFLNYAKFNWNYNTYFIDTKGISLDIENYDKKESIALPSDFLIVPIILKDSYGYISRINLEWLQVMYYSNLTVRTIYVEQLGISIYGAYGPYIDINKLPNSLELYPLEENKDINLEFNRYIRSLASWSLERK